MSLDKVWYIAYGSNMDVNSLGRYLESGVEEAAGLPRCNLLAPHRLFFAGRSRRWGGAVAFLERESDPSACTPRVAYLMTWAQLQAVVRAENGCPDFTLPREAVQIAPGEERPLAVEHSVDGFSGQYNCLVRLDDIDGVAAFTVTTALDLEVGEPTREYTALIARSRWTNRTG